MEQKLKAAGGSHARKRSAGGSVLMIHKPIATSLLLSQNPSMTSFNNSPERSLLASQVGARAKAARLRIKQKFGKDELKAEILG